MIELEERAAALLGQEAAVYLPTATMSNQIALKILTEPGDVLIAEEHSHVFIARAGRAGGALGPVHAAASRVRGAARAGADPRGDDRPALGHEPVTKLVSLENTHNSSGGRVWPLDELDAVVATARELGLRVHLDGARVLNAAVALGVPAAEIGRGASTRSRSASRRGSAVRSARSAPARPS